MLMELEDEKIVSALENIGLSKNEIIVYLDLIKVGKSSAGDISKRTKIHRPNVYDNVENLTKKGIVTKTVEENRKVFYPVPPKDLLGYLKQKEENLRKVIPKIEELHHKPKEERKVTILEGFPSIRNIFISFVESGEPIYIYGLPNIPETLEGFVKYFHEKRIEQKICLKAIYNKDAEKRVREINKMEFSEGRYLTSKYDSNVTTCIWGNRVSFVFWDTPMSVILVENDSLAESYKNYFEILWNEAKMSY